MGYQKDYVKNVLLIEKKIAFFSHRQMKQTFLFQLKFRELMFPAKSPCSFLQVKAIEY